MSHYAVRLFFRVQTVAMIKLRAGLGGLAADESLGPELLLAPFIRRFYFETHLVLLDGPPYANGRLHIGHALNKTTKDIINRYQVLTGHQIHYHPGWDCHGLPIENKALQELKKDALSLPPNVIRAAAKATAEREMKTQQEEFEQFCIMADWSPKTTFRTLDHDYEIRQLQVFQRMVDQAYVTFPLDSQTTIASTALREVLAKEPSANLLVWTTTPWALTANMGIAVHPELIYSLVRSSVKEDALVVAKDRLVALEHIIGPHEVIAEIKGADLVGAQFRSIFSPIHPSGSMSANIIAASHVTSESGSGLVHCAPAHGAEDYLAFRALGLLQGPTDIICHVDDAGKFSLGVAHVVGEEAAQALVGQEVLKGGNKAIIRLLESIGSLVRVQKIKHRYPYDWKTGEPIIVTATSQWFANLDGIKDDALHALKDVQFYPPSSRNRLESFVRSRSEWCISRQRVWGVPIPALYHTPTDTAVLSSESLTHILRVLSERGVAHWWEGPVEDFLTPELLANFAGGPEAWRKGTDTMDVWFDSGSNWSTLSAPTGERKYRADVCLEGTDQHRGWFQSQLLTSVGVSSGRSAARPVSPYGTLITHGMVLDEAGKKMSKSLGNIVSPMTIIHGGKDKKKEPAYGADVLRLWVATVEYWRDMSIGPTVLAQCAESMRKIRNSARFILGNIGTTIQRKRGRNYPHQSERYPVLDFTTSVMAPALPYLAEDIHGTLHEGDEAVSQLSVFAKKWTPSAEWSDPHADQDMASLLRMRSVVLSLLEKARGDKHLKSSLEADVDVILPNDISVQPYLLQLIEREETFLKTLFIVSDAKITDEGFLGTSSFTWSYVSSMDIPAVSVITPHDVEHETPTYTLYYDRLYYPHPTVFATAPAFCVWLQSALELHVQSRSACSHFDLPVSVIFHEPNVVRSPLSPLPHVIHRGLLHRLSVLRDAAQCIGCKRSGARLKAKSVNTISRHFEVLRTELHLPVASLRTRATLIAAVVDDPYGGNVAAALRRSPVPLASSLTPKSASSAVTSLGFASLVVWSSSMHSKITTSGSGLRTHLKREKYWTSCRICITPLR
ncbi:tRNA synthetases class I-domain-containing protein [Suillus discolor]|uniref:isoleucine--tRNA ligase n=1 Tax=Suillus discolor TaxID=1912936 RepID=A0A9P7JS94_9AGAM|nr:tRNA synthetases class I-domain-containing protein [Suillus discolor]KAG2104415.1 tRNA synthetases class I-domain-containing protein [Suillus discolor]